MTTLSRRHLAQYAAEKLAQGDRSVVEQLAAYLVASRRTKEAELLVRDIERWLETNGVVVACVTSAHELDNDTRQAIQQLLDNRYDASSVSLKTTVDPTLLGGVLVETAAEAYDGTLRRSITKLKSLKA